MLTSPVLFPMHGHTDTRRHMHTHAQTSIFCPLPRPDPAADTDSSLSLTQDLHHGRIQMKSLTNKWYEEVRQGPSGSEDDEQELF